MPKSRTEEQFPLLLFLVDDQEVTQNNRRFLRSRFEGITSGATAIITEWPNYLSSCWVTAFICGATLFLLTFMLTSCMSIQYHHRLPRCVPNYPYNNDTIHLAHSSNKWTPKQLQLLDNITHAFPHHKIYLIIIKNPVLISPETATTTNVNKSKNIVRKLSVPDKSIPFEYIRAKYPNIVITYIDYASFFESTPLFKQWLNMSDKMRIFAIRIMQMWQSGGLSFDLLEFDDSCPKRAFYLEKKLKKLIKYGSDKYEEMDSNLISIDRNGLHMECKIPCHAFFERILRKLRKVGGRFTPSTVLNIPMKRFCKLGVIETLFCPRRNVMLFK